MKIRPTQDYILIKRAEEENRTRGGLIIPETAKNKNINGEVLAIGPGKTLDNGNRVEPSVKPGDKILLPQYGGQEVDVDGEKLVLIKEDQILAVFE